MILVTSAIKKILITNVLCVFLEYVIIKYVMLLSEYAITTMVQVTNTTFYKKMHAVPRYQQSIVPPSSLCCSVGDPSWPLYPKEAGLSNKLFD